MEHEWPDSGRKKRGKGSFVQKYREGHFSGAAILRQQQEEEEVEEAGNHIAAGPPRPAVVAGVLPLEVAQQAAADGAAEAIRTLARVPGPGRRRLASTRDLNNAQAAAAAAASTAVYGLALAAAPAAGQEDNPPAILGLQEVVINVASSTWRATFDALRYDTRALATSYGRRERAGERKRVLYLVSPAVWNDRNLVDSKA
ncbi:hypothetical protein EJB05_15100, partial [Eragrostis curvula]